MAGIVGRLTAGLESGLSGFVARFFAGILNLLHSFALNVVAERARSG
jgi:hypothetical protein